LIQWVPAPSVLQLCTALFHSANASRAGVLTKPDRIPAGEEATWINKIQSGGENGGIEYYSVKNPDSQDIRNGITYEQAREKAAEFFSTKSPWSRLEWLYQRRLGTDKLTRRLGQVLSNLISKRRVLHTSNLDFYRNLLDLLLPGFPSCRENSTDCSSRQTTTYRVSQIHRLLNRWRSS